MISLIDGDLVAYRSSASCEKQGVVVEDLGIAQGRANNLINHILDSTSPERDFIVFLSGSENFRNQINPEYKANRKDMKRPEYLEPLREWLIATWGAELQHGREADDGMSIAQSKRDVGESIICTLDKDLRQVPGWHFSWEIGGTGSTGTPWTRPAETVLVSPQEGLFHFYWQLIMGDTADNIFGYDGKARQKIPKFLQPRYDEMQELTEEQDLFNYVRDMYQDDDRLLMNGACMWMQRYEDDDWLQKGKALLNQTTNEPSGTVDNGLRDDTEVS